MNARTTKNQSAFALLLLYHFFIPHTAINEESIRNTIAKYKNHSKIV